MKIDLHQHFWRYAPQDYPWIDESMPVLKRDSGPPREDFARGVERLARRELAYDILLFAQQLPVVGEFVGCFPNQLRPGSRGEVPVAKRVSSMSGRQICDWRQAATTSIAGLPAWSPRPDGEHWPPTDISRYLDMELDDFGAGPVMCGSDWPASTLAVSDQGWVDLIGEWRDRLGPDERTAVLGADPARVYGVEWRS